MKNLFERFLHWISRAFSGSDDVSIKRILGFIMIIVALNLLYFVGFKLIPVDVWIVIEPAWKTIVAVASAYMGVNALLDVAKLVKGGGGPPPPPGS